MVGAVEAPLPVASVSRFVREGLRYCPKTGNVLAVFERACALRMSDGQVVALVEDGIGDGPLNVVLESGVASWTGGLQVGGAVQWDGARLRIGPWALVLDSAPTWEPRPDWGHLRGHRHAAARRLADLRRLALTAAPPGSWLALLSPLPEETPDPVWAAAAGALPALRDGWQGDLDQLRRAAARLAGLGRGLTPAGDDFLSGVLLWAWLAHPEPQRFGAVLLEEAAPRTTTYSAALLQAAARGACNVAWHRLLAALDTGAQGPLSAGVQDVLAYGHTSGADTLAGFLWLATS